MEYLLITIEKVIDDAFPGWVECSLVDASGNHHIFHEKIPVVGTNKMNIESKCPCEGSIRCEVGAMSPGGPAAMVVLNTAAIDGVESIDGVSEFTAKLDQVVSDEV